MSVLSEYGKIFSKQCYIKKNILKKVFGMEGDIMLL